MFFKFLFSTVVIGVFSIHAQARWQPYDKVTDSFLVRVPVTGVCKVKKCRYFEDELVGCEEQVVSEENLSRELEFSIVNKSVVQLKMPQFCKSYNQNYYRISYDRRARAGKLVQPCGASTNSTRYINVEVKGESLKYVEETYSWNNRTRDASERGQRFCEFTVFFPPKPEWL